ncbi:MAG TPA: SLBB domain-containing protein [Gemmatimonadaceae bacterium]
MTFRSFARHAVVLAFLASPALLHAQVPAPGRPTPADAQAALQNRPELVARIRQYVQSSGMTPDQVRARLRAEGYPESLLDAYFAGSGDSTSVPTDEVFEAVRLLGIADTVALDSLRGTARRVRRTRATLDSAFLDTIARAALDDSTREAIRRLIRSRDLRSATLDSGFTIFGLDLFANETTRFDPSMAGPVDPTYRLGPGDRLVLILTGDVEASHRLEVTREGFIVVPQVGQVQVAGLTMSQLQEQLARRLGSVYSGISRAGGGGSTRFSVNMSQLGANQVFVTGDVKQPGSYRVSRLGTAMTALYAAGGPTANGSMRGVQVRRNGNVVGTLDVYDYALRGDASGDLRLENGDVVFVPPRGARVRIAGAVIRPAIYELRPGETLADLLRMSGGFAANAERRRVQVERIVPPAERTSTGADRRFVEVASALFTTGFGPPEPLYAGDVVHVLELPERLTNRVAVNGNVWTPGPVAFVPGMTLSQALRRAGGLRPDSYLGQVLVSRMRPDSTREMLRAVLRDTTGATVGDLPLADGDDIRVFSLTDFRPQRFVTINGAVRRPGRVPYHEGMTMRDLVLLAGGVQESALLTEAEVARLPESRAAGVTAQTIRVPLDSTYLFERTPDGRYLGPPGMPAPRASAPEVVLEPYDAVLILRQPDWQLQRTVNIQGEVRFPGEYSITSKEEKLSDLIQRAGGLTREAYANGVTFYRKRDGVGRIGVDLPRVLRDGGYMDNLALVDGDSVFVPAYAPVVSVRGEVNSPVAVAYVRGADLDYYIRAAGGPTARADAKRAFVTQGNGKVESRSRHLGVWAGNPEPQPGSVVVVPARDPSLRHDWAAIAATTTSLLGSLVAIVALLR